MSWWPFRRRSNDTLDTAQGTYGDGGDPTRRSLMGRLFLRGVPYVVPKDMGEVNRLDFQRYMIGAMPAARGAGAVREVARLRSPGRWIALVAAGTSGGGRRALETVDKCVVPVLSRRNVNIRLGARLGDVLTDAGRHDVTVR